MNAKLLHFRSGNLIDRVTTLKSIECEYKKVAERVGGNVFQHITAAYRY